MKLKAVFASVSLLCLASGPALSQNLVDATQPQRVLEVAKGFGSATLEKDSKGDPKITGRIDGTAYTVFFYGCVNNKDCDNIQFYSAWNASGKYSLRQINEWNRTKRWGKAYLDNDDDPVLEMEANLDFGVSTKNLEDTFDWWKVTLKTFKKDFLKEE
jgi:hypothetical protein